MLSNMTVEFETLSTESARRNATVQNGRPKLIVALIWGLLVLVLLLGFVYYFRLERTSSVLGFRARKAFVLRAYDHFLGFHFTVTDTYIPGTLGPVQIRIYAPVGAKNPPPVILIHGFAPDGNKDGYLNAVAYRLASMGFLVTLPTIPAETHYAVRSSDMTVIGDAIRWTAQTAHQKVSLFGISFSGGLVIPAAAPPAVAKYVKLIFSISGYNNLDSIARYYIRERVNDPYGHPYLGTPPGPLVIVSPYLDDLVPPNDALALGSAIFDQNRGNVSPSDNPALRQMTPAEVNEFKELQTMQAPEMRRRYLHSLERHRAEIAAISPSSVLRQLQVPLYLLHGTHDPVFPEGEVEWTRQETAGKPDVHILVTPWLGHAFVGQPATLWQKFQVLNFCEGMFYRAARRIPIAP